MALSQEEKLERAHQSLQDFEEMLQNFRLSTKEFQEMNKVSDKPGMAATEVKRLEESMEDFQHTLKQFGLDVKEITAKCSSHFTVPGLPMDLRRSWMQTVNESGTLRKEAGESLEKVRAATTEAKALAKKEMLKAAKAKLQLEDDPGEMAVAKARQLLEVVEEKAEPFIGIPKGKDEGEMQWLAKELEPMIEGVDEAIESAKSEVVSHPLKMEIEIEEEIKEDIKEYLKDEAKKLQMSLGQFSRRTQRVRNLVANYQKDLQDAKSKELIAELKPQIVEQVKAVNVDDAAAEVTTLIKEAVDAELSTNIVRQALGLLWHCGNSAQGRVETLQAGGAKCITDFLSHDDAKVREAAVCALNVISLETQGKKDVLQHSLEAIARIIHSESETTYLHETCVQLCRCAAELPAFRFAFARHALKSIWLLEKVFGTTSLAAISPLLSSKEAMETRIQAAVVAEHFLTSKEPLLGDDIRVPPVWPLINVELPPAFGFEECVDILQHLVELIEQTPSAQACLKALVRRERTRQELAKLLRSGLLVVPSNQRSFVESLAAEDQSQGKDFAREELIESFKLRQKSRYLVALQMAMDAELEQQEIPCVYSLHKMSDTFQVPRPPSGSRISCQLCFILDYTANMKTQISQTKESLNKLVDLVTNLRLRHAKDASIDLEMTAVAYTDWDADSAKLGRPVVAAFGGKEIKRSHDSSLTPADFDLGGKFTKDASALRSWIEQGFGHGGQIPEELTGAMLAASYLPWSAQEKLAVIITDAPCHGKDYSSVIHDPFCDPTTGLTCTGKPEVPLRRMMQKGVRVVVLHTGEAHAVSMCSRLQETDPRLLHEKVSPLETCQKLVSVVEAKLQVQPLHYLLKPYQLNPSGDSLPLALNHDVEINEAGVKEKQNTGGDGLIFVGHRVTPTVTVGRPAESELDAWFERKSDQVELPPDFDGKKTYLFKMPTKT